MYFKKVRLKKQNLDLFRNTCMPGMQGNDLTQTFAEIEMQYE